MESIFITIWVKKGTRNLRFDSNNTGRNKG